MELQLPPPLGRQVGFIYIPEKRLFGVPSVDYGERTYESTSRGAKRRYASQVQGERGFRPGAFHRLNTECEKERVGVACDDVPIIQLTVDARQQVVAHNPQPARSSLFAGDVMPSIPSPNLWAILRGINPPQSVLGAFCCVVVGPKRFMQDSSPTRAPMAPP
jgi:hypothetical protein